MRVCEVFATAMNGRERQVDGQGGGAAKVHGMPSRFDQYLQTFI